MPKVFALYYSSALAGARHQGELTAETASKLFG